MSDWIGLPENLNEDEHFGFVYLLTNLVSGRKYVGKKQFWRTIKKPPLKGKKRKRSVTKPSDYESYYGSSEEFKKDVAQYGKNNFKREILAITSCKWESSWLELLYQLKFNAILDDQYLNGIVNLRIPKIPKHLQEKYKNFSLDFTISNDTDVI